MEELQFGQFTLSVIIAVILAFAYKLSGEVLSDRLKVIIAVIVGLGLGIVAIPYNGLDWTVVNIVNYELSGLISSATASGLYTWQKKISS